MSALDEPLAGLERQRLELEENIRKLRQSLYDWRIREAEYDELKEGVASLKADCTKDDIIRLGLSFEATVVDEKELKSLVGDDKPAISRSRDQVIQHISRRLDYVRQNVGSLEKRLETAEAKLDKLLDVERPRPDAANERYAVSEILEELDDEGNVISSKVSKPGDRESDVVELLQKAGVKVPQNSAEKATTVEEVSVKDSQNADEPSQIQDGEATENNKPEVIDNADVPLKEDKPAMAETAAEKVNEKIDGSNDSDSEAPVSEVDESPEDAKLRREMLQYSFHEVGKVVAELEMDEEGSDISYEDDDYDDDDYLDEEEDEYGRTTRPVLTESYHKRMKELEQKLKDGGFINIGPAKIAPLEEPKEEIEKMEAPGIMKTAQTKEDVEEPQPTKAKTKKKVSFASELDIAQDTTPPVKPEPKIVPMKPETAPLSESVVERSPSKPAVNERSKTENVAPKKTSRFKSARASGLPSPGDSSSPGIGLRQSTVKGSQEPAKELKPVAKSAIVGDVFAKPPSTKSEPRPPEGKTLADTLVERPAVHKDDVHPPDPDEIDESIHRKEIASEFYRMRNRKIRQSGGFLNNEKDGEDDEIYELDENDQPKRRVSRFKAARLRP